jgi:hypothetical protein
VECTEHIYNDNDKYYDEEEKEWIEKLDGPCYIESDPERHKKCELYEISIRIEPHKLIFGRYTPRTRCYTIMDRNGVKSSASLIKS